MAKPKTTQLLLIIGIAVLYAFIVRGFFGVDSWQSLYSVMSITFIFLLPVGVGAITIFLSSIDNVEKLAYRIIMPWVPVFAFFILTMLLNIEGWACWLMILPIFLLGSSIGGLIAGYYKLRKRKNEKIYISLLAILPFFISPAEQAIGKIPGQYQAYTYIDIHSSANKIWSNVTRVREISQKEEKGWFAKTLGFPRPIKAELNYEGVGGFRKAIFDKGLVFNETVLSYQPQRKWFFQSGQILMTFHQLQWTNI